MPQKKKHIQKLEKVGLLFQENDQLFSKTCENILEKYSEKKHNNNERKQRSRLNQGNVTCDVTSDSTVTSHGSHTPIKVKESKRTTTTPTPSSSIPPPKSLSSSFFYFLDYWVDVFDAVKKPVDSKKGLKFTVGNYS